VFLCDEGDNHFTGECVSPIRKSHGSTRS